MDDHVEIRVLASGSSGNATFVRVGELRILVDAGISMRRLEAGLASAGVSFGDLDGLLLTHEHSDHVRGVDRLITYHPNTPIFASRGTFEALDVQWPGSLEMTRLRAGRSHFLGDVEICAFGVNHDAAEPTGFRLQSPHFTLGFATDMGFWTDEVAEAMAGCRVLVVESNYDDQLLRNGPYPRFLKRRISSSKGHLSNDQVGALLRRVDHDGLECVVLVHLSEKNNAPSLAVDCARRSLNRDDIQVVAARRKEPSDVLTFDGRGAAVQRQELPRQGVLF